MSNMSAEILREIVASTLKLDTNRIKISGVMSESFEVDEVSTSGNLYSSVEECNVWAFNPEKGLELIEKKLISYNVASNANGTWENSYGYDYRYLLNEAPGALFFVVHELLDYSDSNGSNNYQESYTIYRANIPEIVKKVNAIEPLKSVLFQENKPNVLVFKSGGHVSVKGNKLNSIWDVNNTGAHKFRFEIACKLASCFGIKELIKSYVKPMSFPMIGGLQGHKASSIESKEINYKFYI